MRRLLRLPGLWILRSLIRELRGIREQLTRQGDLLEQLAARYAPQPPVTDRETVARETGLDYVDPIDQALIQQYRERTESATGHAPTDDEILSYLADEKTKDLHERLIARDAELDRLAMERGR
jgi:hypothetical protein